jgi:hypothetical protein
MIFFLCVKKIKSHDFPRRKNSMGGKDSEQPGSLKMTKLGTV